MKTKSVWQATKTYFPLFMRALESGLAAKGRRAAVIGASDGKFVIPLVEKRLRVCAIEIDAVALFGGTVIFPGHISGNMVGLVERLEIEGLSSMVDVCHKDFLEGNLPGVFDAVFTSCSWHYSRNHAVPVSVYVKRMQDMVINGGLFCAEYMMPLEERHISKEHYLPEGRLRAMFGGEWKILDEFYSEPFPEEAHVGNPCDHWHRMGFFMAKKLS